MELYNKKYVYFEWDDELEGKKGFVADDISELKYDVNNCRYQGILCRGQNVPACPFSQQGVDDVFTFAYYDPDYEIKKEFFDGKTIQAHFKTNDRYHGNNEWFDINKDTLSEGYSLEDFDLRMKEELKYYAIYGSNAIYKDTEINDETESKVLAFSTSESFIDDFIENHKGLYDVLKAGFSGETIEYRNLHDGDNSPWLPWNLCYNTNLNPYDFVNFEYRIKHKWYIVLDDYGLSRTNLIIKDKYVVFEGTEDECIKWMDKYGKFEKIMVAWKQDKKIQCKDGNEWVDWELSDIPRESSFNTWEEWRIKDEDVEYVPFDTVQELIDYWDEKHPSNRPADTLPLIWIKEKDFDRRYLITEYYFERDVNKGDVGTSNNYFTLKELFEKYTFLYGATIGKVKEE